MLPSTLFYLRYTSKLSVIVTWTGITIRRGLRQTSWEFLPLDNLFAMKLKYEASNDKQTLLHRE